MGPRTPPVWARSISRWSRRTMAIIASPTGRRGCRRKDRGGPWSPAEPPLRRCSRCRAASGSTRWASPQSGTPPAGRWRCRQGSPPPGSTGSERPSGPISISSALALPVRAAAAMPSPISTPFTALMLIIAAARSWSSLRTGARPGRGARLRPPPRSRRRRCHGQGGCRRGRFPIRRRPARRGTRTGCARPRPHQTGLRSMPRVPICTM